MMDIKRERDVAREAPSSRRKPVDIRPHRGRIRGEAIGIAAGGTETEGPRDERGMAEMTRVHPSGHVPASRSAARKRKSGGGKGRKRRAYGVKGIWLR